MKWARVKPSNQKTDSPEERAHDELCYRDFAKEEHLRKTLEHPSHVWVKHDFSFPFGKEEKYAAFQKRYEIFCGGYLYFYDERVRSGVVDHVLHFRWSPFKRSGKFNVTVFLSPPPQRRRPRREDLRLNEEELVTETGSFSKKGNGIQLLERPQTQPMLAMAKTGDTDGDIDPPPPPPPPPPPMG